MKGGNIREGGKNIHVETFIKKSIHIFSLKKNITNIDKYI